MSAKNERVEGASEVFLSRKLPAVIPRTTWEWVDWFAARQGAGAVLGDLVRTSGRCRRYVQKALWLATWPDSLVKQARERPDVFTAHVLLCQIAGRMRHFSADGWAPLSREIARMLDKGAGARVRKPYRRKLFAQKENSPLSGSQGADPGASCLFEQLAAQEVLRTVLATRVRVDAGEIRVAYFGPDDLDRIVRMIERG